MNGRGRRGLVGALLVCAAAPLLGGCFLKSKDEMQKEAAAPPKPLDQQARQHYNDGIVEEQRKKYVEALGEYYKALELDPKFALAWMAIGNVQQMRGHYLEAERAYKRAIEGDPNSATAKNNLAWLYYSNRLHLDEAEVLAQQAVQNYEDEIVRAQRKEKLPPGITLDSRIRSLRLGMAGCYDTQGSIHQARGRLDKAIEMWYLALGQTAETEPEVQAKFHYKIGAAQVEQKNLDGARQSLARARALTKSPELQEKIAAAERALGAAAAPGGGGGPK